MEKSKFVKIGLNKVVKLINLVNVNFFDIYLIDTLHSLWCVYFLSNLIVLLCTGIKMKGRTNVVKDRRREFATKTLILQYDDKVS